MTRNEFDQACEVVARECADNLAMDSAHILSIQRTSRVRWILSPQTENKEESMKHCPKCKRNWMTTSANVICPTCEVTLVEGGYKPEPPQPEKTAAVGLPYKHPKTITDFESVYRSEYEHELEDCDRWIKWCKGVDDYYGVNFHQGRRSAFVFNNIKMCQLLRVLKGESPNV